MSLDICLFGPDSADLSKSEIVALGDNGYYWYLYPYFERIYSATGEMIDLYGDATFRGESLRQLELILGETCEATLILPDEWDVEIGIQTYPPPGRIITNRVSKAHLLSLIYALYQLATKALAVDGVLSCLGD